MPFVIFLIYVVVVYVYPGEIFPALAPYRITYWVGVSGLAFSALWLVFKRSSPLATIQLWFLAALTLTLAVSRMIGEGYVGAFVPALKQFGPSLAMFVITLCSVDSLRKLRIAAACIAFLSLALVLQGVAAYHFGYKTNMFLFNPVTRAEYGPTQDGSEEDVEATETAESASAAEIAEDVGYTPDDDELGEDEGSTIARIRGLGLLHDPNDLALGLVMALPLLWAAWRRKGIAWNLLLVLPPSAALVYGLFLTRSRGGAFALFVTLCVAASRKIGRLGAILLFATVIAAGTISDFSSGRRLSTSDESVSGRIEAWTEGFEMLKGQPLLGVGYGQFLEHHTLTAHNSFVLCFAETGLIGYFFWLGLLVVTYAQLQSLRNLSDQESIDRDIKGWAAMLQLSMIGFMAAAFFLSRSFVPMLYLLVGLSVALVVIARRENRPVSPPSLFGMGTLLVASEIGSILFIYALVKVDLLLTT
jgi:putative inorganic carbon (hco3(-)) transporter